MEIRFQIGNYPSIDREKQFFETESFSDSSFDYFKKVQFFYEISLNGTIFTIERVDAFFDMFYVKQEGSIVATFYCGMGNKEKNDNIYKYLESIHLSGRKYHLSPSFCMPRSEYFLVIMNPIVLSYEETSNIGQLFYVGLLNGNIKL